MIDTDLLIAYEEGTLEREDFLKLFQQIYDSRAYSWLKVIMVEHFPTWHKAGLIDLK